MPINNNNDWHELIFEQHMFAKQMIDIINENIQPISINYRHINAPILQLSDAIDTFIETAAENRVFKLLG